MLISALVLGLMGSLHCIGMCGPIAFMLPVNHNNKYKKAGQVFIYHFGRLMAYGVIGGLFGLLGKGLYIFGIQQKLSILVGVLMILAVIIPNTSISRFGLEKPLYRIIGKIKNSLGKALKKKTADTFLTIGFLNGFLPCGLVYMALLGAIAMGTAVEGSLYMILFGLGTVPLMTAAVYLSGVLKDSAKQRIRKLIPVFVVIIGVLFIIRGMGLGIPYVSPKQMNEVVSTELECH